MNDATNQSQTFRILIAQDPIETKSGLSLNVDVASTISAVLWPLIVLIILIVYRHKLSLLIGKILSRVKKVEFAGISLEWAEVKELSSGWLVPGGGLDLRSSSNGMEIYESSGANILSQLDQPIAGDYVVIDLGDGQEWLTSRLFILAILFQELRGLKALVFAGDQDGAKKHYIGWTEPSTLAHALAKSFPKLQAAYSAARAIIDKPRFVYLPQRNISVMQMGLVNSQAGSDLFKQFLFRLKPKHSNEILANETIDWTPIPAKPGFFEYAGTPNEATDPSQWVELKGIQFYEYAQWVNGKSLSELLGDQLNTAALKQAFLVGKSESVKIRAALMLNGDYVALVKENDRFDQLVDRRALLEEVVSANLAED